MQLLDCAVLPVQYNFVASVTVALIYCHEQVPQYNGDYKRFERVTDG